MHRCAGWSQSILVSNANTIATYRLYTYRFFMCSHHLFLKCAPLRDSEKSFPIEIQKLLSTNKQDIKRALIQYYYYTEKQGTNYRYVYIIIYELSKFFCCLKILHLQKTFRTNRNSFRQLLISNLFFVHYENLQITNAIEFDHIWHTTAVKSNKRVSTFGEIL